MAFEILDDCSYKAVEDVKKGTLQDISDQW